MFAQDRLQIGKHYDGRTTKSAINQRELVANHPIFERALIATSCRCLLGNFTFLWHFASRINARMRYRQCEQKVCTPEERPRRFRSRNQFRGLNARAVKWKRDMFFLRGNISNVHLRSDISRGIAKSFHAIFSYRFYKNLRNCSNKIVMTAHIYFKWWLWLNMHVTSSSSLDRRAMYRLSRLLLH